MRMGTKHVERLILKTTRAYFENGKYINCRTTQLKSFHNVYILGKLKHICQYRRAKPWKQWCLHEGEHKLGVIEITENKHSFDIGKNLFFGEKYLDHKIPFIKRMNF